MTHAHALPGRTPTVLQPLRHRLAQVRERGAAGTLAAVRRRLAYRNEASGLRRDLSVAFPAPEARLPLRVRVLEERDVPLLLDPDAPGLDQADREERRARLAMLRDGLRTPYVAVDPDDRPVFVQWLLGPDQDEAVARHFGGTFPRVHPGEALLEGAYTPVHARGQRVMPHAMARIAELAEGLGARTVTTWVTRDNAASLTGCARAGFTVSATRTLTWRAGRRRVVFGPAPATTEAPASS